MSGNDDKPHAAADRIKAATLSVAKGLSRAQAERAAAAAARNVNAYGQKEEGPSRWQERKEAKRQMYLMSTEKAAKLGTVKLKASETNSVGAYTQCQKCFQHGHWTYECKNERVYISRPSRTQQLKNPKLKKSVPVSYQFENPDIIREREEEQKLMKEKQKKEKAERKRGKTEDSRQVLAGNLSWDRKTRASKNQKMEEMPGKHGFRFQSSGSELILRIAIMG
ncbi:Zinc finger CCHC domain-containing protein 10 [Zea mays]|uniref:Zinc finger CCHC domain-containing protein 10 n=1 Tax=Zea mays TaxID=4577 RepID=A0A3L6DWC7_MAIZE|nr:Zinc finger CCHC domain-containing protein 10 [Zea mays]